MAHHASTARVLDPESETVRRVVPFVVPKTAKAPKKEKLPTGFYRRKAGGPLYWRRTIDNVDYDQSTGFVDIKSAQKWADDKVEAIKYGNFGWGAKGIPTVREYYDARPSHLKDGRPRNPEYDRYLLPFVDAHAKTKLNQITSEMCREWMASRLAADTQYGKPFSPGTVRIECSHLRAFFNRAVGVGAKKYLRENPWRVADPDERIKLPKKSIATRKLEIEEQPEFLAALGAIGSVYARDGSLPCLAQVIIGSGLRREEICMLRPEDVHHGHIHVREETAKWGKFRKVPVGTDVLALLDEQRVRRGLGVRSEERYFVVCPAYLDQLFMKASILSQMKPTICPHDLRRTYGSRMAFKVPPKALQLLMGHADIKTTMEHYVDVDAAKLASVVASVGSPLVG